MCASIPLKIISINEKWATCEDGRKVGITLVPDVKRGDYVKVFANIALEIMDKKNVQAMLEVNQSSKA
jgi:hydrogenase assembly chaperone HypC/HupF